MFKRFSLLSGALLLVSMLMAPVAGAECADQPQATAPAPEAAPADLARDAGDDPVITQPVDPTCDDAGYTAEFPDVELATDAADPVPGTSTGGGYVPSGTLPVTGPVGPSMLLLVFAAFVLVTTGTVLHLETANRDN
jgi:hypothetical protein